MSVMRGRCVWLREISPGEREMATSGGEREDRQAWTHDNLVIFYCQRQKGFQGLYIYIYQCQIIYLKGKNAHYLGK